MLILFALYESLTRFVTPWVSAIPSRQYYPTPITQGNNIIDITGVGISQFWSLRGHLQDSSTLATAHYPETLDKIFVSCAENLLMKLFRWLRYPFPDNRIVDFTS